MKVKIDKVTDVKSDQRGTSCKMHAGNSYWFVNEDATPLAGKEVEIDVTEKTSAKGNKYSIAKIVKVLEGAAPGGGGGNGNGHIAWSEYEQMAGLAHQLALTMEPDAVADHGQEGAPIITVDRSTARAAILNTVMIAFSNGKISLPAADDDMPF